MKTSHSVYLDRPVSEVFGFLAKVANETRWRQSIVGSRYVGADLPAVGIDGETDVEMGSKSLTMRWTVTELVDGEYVAWRLDGDPWNGGGSYRVLARGEGSEVHASLEVRLKGAARLVEPILGMQFRRGLRADLERLASLGIS
jgi:hypothetical protein